MERKLESKQLEEYQEYLRNEEKAENTIEKYIRDVRRFYEYAGSESISKELVVSYKKALIEQSYAIASINSMLAAVNSFLSFAGWKECRVKGIRIQKQFYCSTEQELSREEYRRLLKAANMKPRLQLVIQTICSTGIRVSELSYFTVAAVKKGAVNVECKNKNRQVMIPKMLKKKLLNYARNNQIKEGHIFCTRSGKPLDRTNIWAEMKALSKLAGVGSTKVFPHNLRKLFARTFYKIYKDMAELADVLGHSNINTTRIYIVSAGREHRKKIEHLGLVW